MCACCACHWFGASCMTSQAYVVHSALFMAWVVDWFIVLFCPGPTQLSLAQVQFSLLVACSQIGPGVCIYTHQVGLIAGAPLGR